MQIEIREARKTTATGHSLFDEGQWSVTLMDGGRLSWEEFVLSEDEMLELKQAIERHLFRRLRQ